MIKIKNAVNNTVKGIFFDYGGVLEDLVRSDSTFKKGVSFLQNVLGQKGIDIDPERLAESLKSGQEEYDNWYNQNNYKELPNKKCGHPSI